MKFESIVNVESLGYLNKSDHQIISVTVEFSSSLKQSDELIYDWGRADNDGLDDYFRKIKWRERLNGKQTEEIWQEIKSEIMTCMNQFIPQKIRRTNNKPVWLSRN